MNTNPQFSNILPSIWNQEVNATGPLEVKKWLYVEYRNYFAKVRHCHIEKDISTKEAARIYGVTVSRIQQIIREYRERDEMPVLKNDT